MFLFEHMVGHLGDLIGCLWIGSATGQENEFLLAVLAWKINYLMSSRKCEI